MSISAPAQQSFGEPSSLMLGGLLTRGATPLDICWFWHAFHDPDPTASVVYCYFASDGTPVYVGQTGNWYGRRQSHRKRAKWWSHVDESRTFYIAIEYDGTPPDDRTQIADRKSVEEYFIENLLPWGNAAQGWNGIPNNHRVDIKYRYRVAGWDAKAQVFDPVLREANRRRDPDNDQEFDRWKRMSEFFINLPR